jgi:endonuclease/exonuclease/phosphatase family metal-dependent hydrolase
MSLRVASFNVENLDDKSDGRGPPLSERAPILRAEFTRLAADIVCLQEVHGQEKPDHASDKPSRALSALDAVLAGTPYEGFERVFTTTTDGQPYDERNLVILSRFPIRDHAQYRNDLIDDLAYRKVTARPEETEAKKLGWERPILHARIEVPGLGLLHVIDLHLKSRLATNVPGQRHPNKSYVWLSAAGWAEGYFMSSIKRVGQALEARILIDRLFDEEPEARILVCGDFNSEPGEVPVEAIAGRVENTGNDALRSRVLIPTSASIAASVRFSHLHEGHGNLLDHMLFSQALLPYFRSARIHNENLHDESLPFASDTKFPESDHAAFLAEFELP